MHRRTKSDVIWKYSKSNPASRNTNLGLSQIWGGMFELSTSRFLVPAFLLIVGPPPCDASVEKYDHFLAICPIFLVSLPTNSVDSGLPPRITLCFLTPPSPPPPPVLAPLLDFVTTQSFLYSTTIKRYTRLYPL